MKGRSSPTYRAVCSTSSGPDAYAALLAETELRSDQAENRWRSQMAESFYWSLRAKFLGEGRGSQEASSRAMRGARAAVLRRLGVEQHEIPGLLGISKRTADADLKHWNQLVASGDVQRVGAQPLPPIPAADRQALICVPAKGSRRFAKV
jgi:hypothetical protein